MEKFQVQGMGANMFNFLTTHSSVIGLVLSFIGIVISILVALGILKRYSTSKTRMKKKITQRLAEEANMGNLLFPEIRLRDRLLRSSWIYRNFSKNFYTLFFASIRELTTQKEIIRVDTWDITYNTDERKKCFPDYSSKAKKKPANYGLKEADPHFYLGLNSQEPQDYLEDLKSEKERKADLYRGAYS